MASIQPQDRSSFEGLKATPKPMMPPEIRMSDQADKRLANYLADEISSARSERYEHIRKLARLREKYKAKFPETPKDWPIANSSQITIPIIKTAHNTLAARIYQTIMAAEPLASMRTEDPQFQDFAHDLEVFTDLYGEEKLKMPELLDGWTAEIILLGTGILETTTLTDRRVAMVYDPETMYYRRLTEDVFTGPTVYHVPLEDFWIRPTYQDLQKAPWCGKEVRLSWSQLKDMALSGELDGSKLDRIWRYRGEAELNVPETILKQEELEKLVPYDRDTYSLFELSVRWDTDGDGIEEEIMVYFHESSRTLLRKKFSGFRRRPWHRTPFVSVPHWFYGEGEAEMLEHLQEEISTVHNQRIDNATIANLKIILVTRMMQGLRPGDRLWSGKVVKVSNVKEDVGTLQLGEIYPSTVQNEQIALQYVDRLSGVGETAAGTARPVSRTTATAQLALLEELNRRFDKVVKSMRRTLKDVFDDVTNLLTETGTNGLAEEWLGLEKGRRLENFLAMPAEIIRRKIKVQIKATRSTVNREVEFQTQLAVFNLILQMWSQIRQEAASAPQVLPLLQHEMLKAIKPVFKKVMQYADAPDPDAAVSVLSVLERILPSPEDMGGMGAARQDETDELLRGLTERVRGELGGPTSPEEFGRLGGVEDSPRKNGRSNRGGVRLPDTGGEE